MLANDARILIRSAVATAIAGVILIAVSAIAGGPKGALGAVLGVTLVTAFFTLSVVAVSIAGRWGPGAMMGTALGIFVLKILVLLVLVATFQGTTLFNTRLFGLTAIVCILVWSAGQVVTLARRKILYVEPEAGPAAPEVTGVRRAGQASGVPETRQARGER